MPPGHAMPCDSRLCFPLFVLHFVFSSERARAKPSTSTSVVTYIQVRTYLCVLDEPLVDARLVEEMLARKVLRDVVLLKVKLADHARLRRVARHLLVCDQICVVAGLRQSKFVDKLY
jgi:hypothetical protein